MGPDGCHALFIRALAQTRAEFPALEGIRLTRGSDPYIEGVAELIMADGDTATADALASMLVHLLELLGRLIGDDMAMKLIERSLPESDRSDATHDSRREEA